MLGTYGPPLNMIEILIDKWKKYINIAFKKIY